MTRIESDGLTLKENRLATAATENTGSIIETVTNTDFKTNHIYLNMISLFSFLDNL